MYSMAENIGTIRQKLQAAAISELPALFLEYEMDSRAGVQAEIAKAKKRILAYEKEVARTEALKRYLHIHFAELFGDFLN